MDVFLQILIISLGTGAIYAIAAQGMVLIYRGSGVLNFAHGATAFVAAEVFVANYKSHGLLAATLLAIAVAAVLGAATQLLVMSPLRKASPLVRVIATLGLLTVFQYGAVLIWGAKPRFAKGILPNHPIHLTDSIKVSTQSLWLVGIAVVLTVVLWIGYRFTQFGRATVAVAEDETGAAAVGWSPLKIATINWAAGAALAGFAGVLIQPITGTNSTVLTLLVVPALAAALIGGFRSFPLTLFSGLAIGVIEGLVQQYVKAPGWPQSTAFLIVIIYLVLRGKSLPLRGHLVERLPRLSEARVSTSVVIVAIAVAAALVLLLGSDFSRAVTATLLMAIVALSVVVVTGYAGQLSLAQLAIAGLGALVAGRAGDVWRLPFPLAVLLAAVVMIPVGLIIGVPALRTRGVNLAIATLGLTVLVQSLILGNPSFTGGPIRGTVLPSPSLFGLNVDSTVHPQRYALVTLGVFTLLGLAVVNLRRGRIGRRLVAIRNNERAAASLGISVFAGKLYAFSFGAVIAGIGGALMAFQFQHVLFDTYSVPGSVNVVVYAVIGGIGSVAGSVVAGTLAPGSLGQWVLGHWVDPTTWFIFAGGVLFILTVVLQPDGVARKFQDQLEPLAKRLRRKKSGHDLGEGTVLRVRPETLEVDGVGVRFGGVVALDGAGLRVEPGEVVGLIGPNGAGKTTLVDVVTGNARGYTGTVRLGDRAIDSWPVARRAREGIGRSFQSVELFEDMSVYDNLRTASEAGQRSSGYVADLFWPHKASLSPAAIAAVHEFGLAADLDSKPAELSYGRRRLLSMARAVALAPSVLLLDEPAAGLGDDESAELGALITRLARDWGMAVLMIEHDVDLVMRVCDRVVALDFGKVIASGSPQEVRGHPAVVAAYLGSEETQVAANDDRDGISEAVRTR